MRIGQQTRVSAAYLRFGNDKGDASAMFAKDGRVAQNDLDMPPPADWDAEVTRNMLETAAKKINFPYLFSLPQPAEKYEFPVPPNYKPPEMSKQGKKAFRKQHGHKGKSLRKAAEIFAHSFESNQTDVSNEPKYDLVDIGCGYGGPLFVFAEHMHRYKARPKCLAIETEPEVLAYAKKEAKNPAKFRHGRTLDQIADVEFYEYDLLYPNQEAKINYLAKLPDNSARLVLLSSMLHDDAEKRNLEFLREAARIVMPGGQIAVTHWYSGYPHRGPAEALRGGPGKMVSWGYLAP